MAKHIIGLKRIGFWVFAMLLVGVYVPGLLSGNNSPAGEYQYCSLEKGTKAVPIRVWANNIYDPQQWVAAN